MPPRDQLPTPLGRLDGEYDRRVGPRSVETAIGAIASAQHGVVSRSQLHELGLTRAAIDARVKARRLYLLHRGVYAVGHVALTSRSRDLGAVLACGPDALLSHRSAAVLWGLLGSSSARIEVTAPRSRAPRDGIRVHRSRLIHPDDRAVVDAIPVTSVARTIVDAADVLDDRRLAGVINEAELRALFDLEAIEATVKRLPGRRGMPRLRRRLEGYIADPRFSRSEAERRFMRMCRTYGLPAPQANVWIGSQEVDAYWPDARLAVEIDGAAFHRTHRAFHEDRSRDRRLAALGILVTRVTWRDLSAPATLVAELAEIRARRLGETTRSDPALTRGAPSRSVAP